MMYNIYVDGRKHDFDHNVVKAIAIATKLVTTAKLKVEIKNEVGNVVWKKCPS